MPRSPRATMIPPVHACTISSAFSAASRFSIFAITGMSAPRSASRACTGSRSLGVPHERHREQVDVVLDGEVDPVEVGLAHRGGQRLDAGQVHALVRRDRCRRSRPASGPASSSALAHPQPDRAVGEVDHVVGLDRAGKPGPPDGDRVAAVASPRSSSASASCPLRRCITSPSMSPSRSFGPGMSPSSADLAAGLRGGLARHLDQPRVVFARAVREVEPQHVRADRDQPAEDLGVVGRRPEGRDDLGAAHVIMGRLAHGRRSSQRQSRSRPQRNSSASLQRPGGTRSAMSPRPKRSSVPVRR